MFNDVIKKYDLVNELVYKIGDKSLVELSDFLGVRISSPDSYVVFLGETSSGKTTILNGLLGTDLLYTSVKPATGAITEICFNCDVEQTKFYAINKNATMEELTESVFHELSAKPDDALSRLRIECNVHFPINGNLRLFDTPGYGSLIEKHEEVLLNFIPESNIIVYVVAYKVGIQQDDMDFLNYAKNIISDGTEFILVINRAPDNINNDDLRIDEIKSYISDYLHYSPKCFIVKNEYAEEGEYPLPKCDDLWSHIGNNISSEENQKRLLDSYVGYVYGLYQRCEYSILKKQVQLELSLDEIEQSKLIIEGLNSTNLVIRNQLIIPTFDKIIEALYPKIKSAKARIEKAVFAAIDDASKLGMDEMMTYINQHLLPFETQSEMDDIKLYIEAELKALDRKIEDKLNRELAKIEKVIELHFNTATADMAKGFIKRTGGKMLEQSLLNYFKQFAGRGGTGIANASKHLLKKVGDLFGKTFSRETHNKLASFLSKIGATSAKAVGMSVSVILEGAFMAYETLTWQNKLKKISKEGLEKWHDEVLELSIRDLKELKEENIRLIDEEINAYISGFNFNDIVDDDFKNYVNELTTLLEEVKVKIGYEGEENEK